MTTLACVKIGPKFGWEYVERLWSMADRHTTGPLSFLLLTDDATGAPLDMALDRGRDCRVVHTAEPPHWAQLELFRPGVLTEPALYLDLDSVVVANIDEMLAYPAPLVAIKDINLPMFGSGIMRVEPDAAPEVWEAYADMPPGARSTFAYKDQQFMTQIAGGEFVTWPEPWCASYKKDVRPRGRVPADAKVVYFHGPFPKNHDVAEEPWMLEHWR